MLGCDVPVVLAGMGGVSRAELVAAVSNAGGFGFLGMVRESPALIRSEIAAVRAATAREFGVNLIPAATDPVLLEAELEAVLAEQVAAVTLFWDLRPDIVRRLRDAGCKVLCQVGSLREAQAAEAAGAHLVIAQGIEAGGHVRGSQDLRELVAELVAQVHIPVLAAGGIVNGRGLADMLALGAQGVVIGTAFLATRESFAHDYHKQRIVDARPGDTIHTRVFHINWPVGAPVRVLHNSVTRGERGNPFSTVRQIIGHEQDRPIYLFSTDSPLCNMHGDFEAMALYAGEGSGVIHHIPGAAQRLRDIVTEARELLASTTEKIRDDAVVELASPACAMSAADDEFMGYAGRDELVQCLVEALQLAGGVDRQLSLSPDRERLRNRLLAQLRQLAGTSHTLHGNTPVSDRGEILQRLRQWLPRVRNDVLHADLTEWLRSHEADSPR
ncbi:NAD(P)H-dependent flavin oxidoreductase [Arenimonas sp.]|uniref:NAD(P)H-dependent flavin oxidoreductase n=1 Tax=Arenimonas sp. TaxID=1872635 RepID=UPI0039E6BAE7